MKKSCAPTAIPSGRCFAHAVSVYINYGAGGRPRWPTCARLPTLSARGTSRLPTHEKEKENVTSLPMVGAAAGHRCFLVTGATAFSLNDIPSLGQRHTRTTIALFAPLPPSGPHPAATAPFAAGATPRPCTQHALFCPPHLCVFLSSLAPLRYPPASDRVSAGCTLLLCVVISCPSLAVHTNVSGSRRWRLPLTPGASSWRLPLRWRRLTTRRAPRPQRLRSRWRPRHAGAFRACLGWRAAA